MIIEDEREYSKMQNYSEIASQRHPDVKDAKTFRESLNGMISELEMEMPSWENKSLESFLDALGRYAVDTFGKTNQSTLSWQELALILDAARTYD